MGSVASLVSQRRILETQRRSEKVRDTPDLRMLQRLWKGFLNRFLDCLKAGVVVKGPSG